MRPNFQAKQDKVKPKGPYLLFALGRMRRLGLRNSRYLLPLIAFLIVLLCFLQYHYRGPVEKGDRKYRSEKQELIQVLRRATMPDKTVILTMVDESYASPGSMLDVLLLSFKSGEGTHRLLNHLVIITMDPQAFEYCRSLHPNCIHPSTFEPYFTNRIQSITIPDHNAFSWRRNNVLIEVIELGYNIIFTDADVLWLRSPFINFKSLYDLTISCNFSRDGQGAGYLQDGGIFFLKASAIALAFFKYWKLNQFVFPNSNAEESLCTTIMQSTADAHGFRVEHVDTNYFGGFCKLNKDMFKEAYTIHANCCDDLTSKVHDLRIVLDDWIRFSKHVPRDNASDKMALTWPQKCTR